MGLRKAVQALVGVFRLAISMLFRVGCPSYVTDGLKVEVPCRTEELLVVHCVMEIMALQAGRIVDVVRMQKIVIYESGRLTMDVRQVVANTIA